MPIEPTTPQGRDGLAAILADPAHALVAFDYDGTLAPIVDDPKSAFAEPDIAVRLAALSRQVGRVAVVTGRPARLAADLGGFDQAPGLESLVVLGHYGMERWDAATKQLLSTPAPPGVERVRRELPALLMSLGLEAADIEDKGMSLAVHVRRLGDAEDAFARMEGPLASLADSAGLVSEPGRLVVELRPPGMDKGQALRGLVHEGQAKAVAFVGDDLGDLAAFDEVRRLRDEGVAGLLVCSGSAEVTRLAERADLVVNGPPGVSALVAELVEALSR